MKRTYKNVKRKAKNKNVLRKNGDSCFSKRRKKKSTEADNENCEE